ncbi:MAG: MoaD/ThiS family protein [Bacteroidetes bacterium]|nr:MAG: MoaD/ThiS family protein [Bacteroidota bacterium]
MKITVLAFGISREIVGGPSLLLDLPDNSSVGQLLELLHQEFPELKKLRSLAVAVNTEYAEKEQLLSPQDEVVLIPPVAGG